MMSLRRALQAVLQVEDTPHRVALAFGIGVWIAFFPIWGIHTAMALGVAFLMRLSRAAMLIGAWVNNPWTMAPLYTAGTVIGCVLLRVPSDGLTALDWSLGWRDFLRSLLDTLRPYLWPFVVGNLLLGTAGALVGYFLLRLALEARRRRLATAP
jgi:uncharacterized protein (DUF2062 family)